MTVEEILDKTTNLLKDDEDVYYIEESPTYYLCYFANRSLSKEFIQGYTGGASLIQISKKTLKTKIHRSLPNNLLFWPIPHNELMRSKCIYDKFDQESIEK